MGASINVYELRCPDCGIAINGLATDTVFTCSPCARAYIPHAGKLVPQQLFWAAPIIQSNQAVVFLPFWKMAVDIAIYDPDERLVTSSTVVRDIDSIWVAAFYEVRPAYFGNPGLNFSIARINPLAVEQGERLRKVVGMVRSISEATAYAPLFVTHILDKATDVTGYRIDVSVTALQLWAMPFAFTPHTKGLHDLVAGFTYQSAIVEYLDEMI